MKCRVNNLFFRVDAFKDTFITANVNYVLKETEILQMHQKGHGRGRTRRILIRHQNVCLDRPMKPEPV